MPHNQDKQNPELEKFASDSEPHALVGRLPFATETISLCACAILLTMSASSGATHPHSDSMVKAFDISPASCRFHHELTRRTAYKRELVFSERYFDAHKRWSGLDQKRRTIKGTHRHDPEYYYTDPVSRLSGSGIGSNVGNSTAAALTFLVDVIRDYAIETMLDVPCGDVNWQFGAWEIDSIRAYVGLDIVHEVIALASHRFSFHTNKRFVHWDATLCELPKMRMISMNRAAHDEPFSLIHVRDLIQHLRLNASMRIMHNIMRSGASYLVSTTFPLDANSNVTANRQILRDGDFFLADLQRPPFDLPTPVRCRPTHPHLEADLTCLWRLHPGMREAWMRQHPVPQPKVVDEHVFGFDMIVGRGASRTRLLGRGTRVGHSR